MPVERRGPELSKATATLLLLSVLIGLLLLEHLNPRLVPWVVAGFAVAMVFFNLYQELRHRETLSLGEIGSVVVTLVTAWGGAFLTNGAIEAGLIVSILAVLAFIHRDRFGPRA
jgi:uncharacterized membrane protein